MSDQDGARPTVALVHEQIKTTQLLLKSGFADIRRELDAQNRALAGIPEQVARHGVTLDDHERRLGQVEQGKKSDREWRRGPLLTLAGSFLAAVITVALTSFL